MQEKRMRDDVISRQTAIEAMTNTLWHYPNECYRNLNEYEFCHGLAELGLKSVPSAQPTQTNTSKALDAMDCVSRQAAIGVVRKCSVKEVTPAYMLIDKADVMTELMMLPSAQPEIVRCKDCQNSEHWYRDRRRCFLWSEDGVSVFDDGFCNYAERRTDA